MRLPAITGAAPGGHDGPHRLLAAIGAGLVVITSVVGSGFSVFAIPLTLWAMLPYGALMLAGRITSDRWAAAGAGAAALAAELGIRAAVFVWPRGSTAAVALVFSPVYILAIVMPAGAALGWLSGHLWRWHRAGRAIVVAAAPAILALLALGLARPELFPTAILSRRASLERIGPPRVAVGSESFESVEVSNKSAWRLTGALDEDPGEELAIVDHSGADLVDPETLEVKGRVDFPNRDGRLWTAFSTLVRLPGGGLAVADTGGGFSATRLKNLNGEVLWAYDPDPTLARQALHPADLDEDGVVEFYSASTALVARLDVNGREVWRRPSQLASIVATLPTRAGSPGWIVGVEFGRRATVWSPDGQVLGERDVAADDGLIGAVDFSTWRALVQGRQSVRGYALDGTALFDVPLGDDFTLTQATGVRLFPDRLPFLVLVAAAERDTGRWRLLIIDPDLRLIYDEILDHFASPLVVGRPDGSQALFVSEPLRLRLLRPRR